MKSEGPFDFPGDSSHTSANRTRMPRGLDGRFKKGEDEEPQGDCIGLAGCYHMVGVVTLFATLFECPFKRPSIPGGRTCARCRDHQRLMRELTTIQNHADLRRLKGGEKPSGRLCENGNCSNKAEEYDHKHGTFDEKIVELIRAKAYCTGFAISRFDSQVVRGYWTAGEVRLPLSCDTARCIQTLA